MGRASVIESSQYQKASNSSAHSRRVNIIAMTTVIWVAPIVVICLWHTIVNLDGSGVNMWKYWKAYSFEGLRKIWPMPSFYAVKLIVTFGIFEALLQMYVPGERHVGILSPTGNRATYKKNGFTCCVITLFVFYFAYKEKHFVPAGVYDHLGEIYSSLIVISSTIVSLLFLKGYTYPSSSDWGSTGNVVVDFYWGLELYPRLGKDFDLKLFFVSRFGMMGWGCLVICFVIRQWEQKGKLADSMLVTSLLMLTYIFKFYWWEAGYLNSLTMMHDRAGFYTIWGSMVWVPALYSSPALYLVNHPVELGKWVSLYIMLGGLLCIYTLYNIDTQRQKFRETHGKAKVWGNVATKIIAHYATEDGKHKQTMLLTSGWWGIARHVHYIFEIGAYFFWSVPALFAHGTPYISFLFIIFFLLDRCERDDKRCKAKYTKYWDLYKKKVPNKIIPLIY